MSSTNRDKTPSKDTVCLRQRREDETRNQNKERQRNVALRTTARRKEETPEQTKERQRKNALRMSAKRKEETPDQKKDRQRIDTTARRKEETPEQTKERQRNNALRTTARRKEETPEHTKERQRKNALRMAAKREEEALNGKSTRRKRRKIVKQQISVDNDEIIDEVPNIAQFVETSDSFKSAYQYLHNTRIGDDENIHDYPSLSRPGMDFPLRGMVHQANVCVCCDRFITGVSEVKWIKKQILLLHHRRLMDDELPKALKDCYRVFDPDLQHLLLSPRARVNIRDEYICCSQCSDSLRSHMKNKLPPKFSISNKWAIGTLPPELLALLTEVTGPLISPVRPFAYVMSFTGGAHKSIMGAFTFFNNNVEENVGALNQHVQLTDTSSVYVVMSGRFTQTQRSIIRKRCLVEVDNFLKVYNWLREHNPHYAEMPEISECPSPIIFEDEPGPNNTDNPENPVIENNLDFQYFFPSHEEPNHSTGTFSSEKEFLEAFMKGKEPTLVFSSSAYQNDWQITLSQLFPLYFPFGSGDIKDSNRENKVSDIEAIKHYLRLSLPQFQKPDFLLVLGHILFRKLAFQSASVRCMSKVGNDGISLGEAFSTVSDEQILNLSKAPNLRGEGSENRDTIPVSLLHTIKASCKNVPYSDEAALEARTKLFAMWATFGPPSIFFTISPADECSFRVSLFCNTSMQNLPSADVSENDCVASMLFRAKERIENPGACAREFNALRDIIMEILIGWNSKEGKQTRPGIFGNVVAWGDTTEEQGRFTLHAHILLFIKDFDRLISMLWSTKQDIREKAKAELIDYFEKIMCSSYDITEEEMVHDKGNINVGGLFYTNDVCTTVDTQNQSTEEEVSCRIPPVILDKQAIRNMRNKEMMEHFEGIVAYCPCCFQRFTTTSMITNALKCWYGVAKKESPDFLPASELQFPLSKARQESFAIRFSYDMERLLGNNESSIKKFLVAVSHLRFNEHDWRHRPGCFKKGCECRFDFPRWTQEKFDLVFGPEESSGKWYKAYGSGPDLEAKGFSLVSKRDIPDVFLNAHNKAVSMFLGYNNNITSGGRDLIYYVTLYNTKSNQKEEQFPFYKQCIAISKRMARLRERDRGVEGLVHSVDNTTEIEDEPSYGRGLGHVLSGICAHLSSSVISATMAWHLIMNESRFRFSHDFVPILLSQMEDWLLGKDISFRYRRSKITGNGWLDSLLMNYLFRPLNDGFDTMCCWEFFMKYELVLKSSLKQRKENGNNEDETLVADPPDVSDVTYLVDWEFLDDHPGKQFACLKKMKKEKVPMLYYRKDLPDLELCKIDNSVNGEPLDESVKAARNEYATVMLLLFYPFRDTIVFGDPDTRWELFCEAVNNGSLFWDGGKRIMQNIQDIHNSKKMTKPKDKLVVETELQRFTKSVANTEDDSDNDSTSSNIDNGNDQEDEMEQLMEELAYVKNRFENHGTNNICTNTNFRFNQAQLAAGLTFNDENILREFAPDEIEETTQEQHTNQPRVFQGKKLIQIIMDFDRPLSNEEIAQTWASFNDSHSLLESDTSKIVDRIDAYAKIAKLDVYQKAAFDIICSSFMLTYLEKDKLNSQEGYNEAREKLIGRGAEKQLLLFLSGAGGCGKSHVINAAQGMCQHFCRCINKGFDSSAFLVTASTNSAATLIGGSTIHSVAQLRSKFSNVSINGKDIKITWINANLIIIDEISMLSLKDFIKLDKHLRKLMREVTRDESRPFGGLHIILCGDFFQLNPVMAIPIYTRNENVLWNLINHVIFLKGYNHRFENDPDWGQLLDRMRLGLLTDADYDFLDSRVLSDTLKLPDEEVLNGENVSYACPTNALRNCITENNFFNMLKNCHPLENSEDNAPNHSVIIKGIFKNRKGGSIKSQQFHRLVYNSCGDDKIIMSGGNGRVDPCLKLSVGCSVMVSEYKDLDKQVVKGVRGKFVGLELKPGVSLTEEIWSGYKVYTVDSVDVHRIICERIKEKKEDPMQYFSLPTKKFSVQVQIPIHGRNNVTLSDMELTQFPINLDQATTGHKLQGVTRSYLVVADYNYSENWVYVAMSRVKTSNGLFLFKKINRSKCNGPSNALLREMELLENIEQHTLRRLQVNGHFPTDIDVSQGIISTIRNAKRMNTSPVQVSNKRQKSRAHVRSTSTTNITPQETFYEWLILNNLIPVTDEDFEYTPGNCLYDSVAYLHPVWKSKGKHLRSATIKWAREQLLKVDSIWTRQILETFELSKQDEEVTYGLSNYVEYLDYIEDPKVYATTLDLYMLSHFLQTGIEIYSTTSNSNLINDENTYQPNRLFSDGFEEVIIVLYDPQLLHYKPILNKN